MMCLPGYLQRYLITETSLRSIETFTLIWACPDIRDGTRGKDHSQNGQIQSAANSCKGLCNRANGIARQIGGNNNADLIIMWSTCKLVLAFLPKGLDRNLQVDEEHDHPLWKFRIVIMPNNSWISSV